MGFANWFKLSTQGYSQHIAGLTKLTRKNHVFTWDLGCEHAFQWVKKAPANALVLAHPDFTKQFTVWADASIDGVNAVLQQKKRPIAYGSAEFSPAARNRGTRIAGSHTCSEEVAWIPGRGSTPCQAQANHQPLTYLMWVQARLAEYLSHFDIEWEYLLGQRNIDDALSRMPCVT